MNSPRSTYRQLCLQQIQQHATASATAAFC